MPLPPNDYVTMLSILLALLCLTVSTRAFNISVPYLVILNKPATAAWTRDERDQGDFVFLVRSLQNGESKRLLDVPNNLSSGTISLNFTHSGCYEVGIGGLDTDHMAIRIGRPVLVLELDKILNIPCKIETHDPKPSASSRLPDTALSSTTSNSATGNWPYHVSSFSAFPTSDSSLSSSIVASSSSSIVSPTSRYGTTIPSSGTSTSSSSDALSTSSQSTSFSSSSGSRTVHVSSSIAVTSSSSSLILTHSQSVSSSPSSATGSVSVSSTATSSQSVSNSSSATSSPVPLISTSSSLSSSNATDSDGSVPTTSFTGLSSTSQQFLQVTPTSTIDIIAASTSIATSPTNDFTSVTLSSAPSSQATGYTTHTAIPSSTSVLPPDSTLYPSYSMKDTRLPKVLGGVFAALSILLVILGVVLCWRHRRLKARTRDIEAHENFNRRSGGLLTRPGMAGTQTPQSSSSPYISSRSSSIDSVDEIVRLLDPSGHAAGPEYARTTTHESHESDHLTRRESSYIASEHSYHSLTSNPFLDPPEGPLLPELPRPNAVKRKSSVVQSPARSATQRSNGTTDSGTSRKTSRPESYFFMFVDGVMQPLDSRSDRYRSLVLSSECSFLMPDQVVLQERADALHEEIVWLRRKVTSLPSDKEENEELLATIRIREENLKRLDREIEGEARQRQSDSFTPFPMDDMVTDYSRISR